MRMATWLKVVSLMITGVFISPIDYRELLGYSGMGVGTCIYDAGKRRRQSSRTNHPKIQVYCHDHNLEHNTHKDTNLFALAELIKETEVADCLIISSELFYENIDKRAAQ
jgi:hypothetical protein